MRRAIVLNLLGALLPAIVAVFCVRQIVAGLGNARFGVLALAWTFINAVGILDLGIGRALTRFLAVHEERDAAREASTVWSSLALMGTLGACGGAVVWGFAHVLAASLAHGDEVLQRETTWALRALALSAPLVVLSSGLRGILEAFGRFDLTNRVSIPISILNLVLPVVLLRFGASLPAIVSALVLVRLGGTLLFVRSVLGTLPALRAPRLAAKGMYAVLSFAGWATISNIPGPLLAQLERFFLGSMMGLTAVAFYSTPADLLSRITIVPAAILQVIFPVLAQTLRAEPQRAGRIAERALLLVAAAVLPALTLLVAIAPEALHVWLGPEFSTHASGPARIAAIALFVNCAAWLPFSVVQSAGRADLTGRLHLVEIPLHVALTAVLIHADGIRGAALAALLRAATDAAVVVWLATRVVGGNARLGRQYALFVGAGALVMIGAGAPLGLSTRLVWSIGAMLVLALGTWRFLLDATGRAAFSAELAVAWSRLKGLRS